MESVLILLCTEAWIVHTSAPRRRFRTGVPLFFSRDARKASANSVSIEQTRPDSPTPPARGQVSINVNRGSCQPPVGGHLCEERTGRSGHREFVCAAAQLYTVQDARTKERLTSERNGIKLGDSAMLTTFGDQTSPAQRTQWISLVQPHLIQHPIQNIEAVRNMNPGSFF